MLFNIPLLRILKALPSHFLLPPQQNWPIYFCRWPRSILGQEQRFPYSLRLYSNFAAPQNHPVSMTKVQCRLPRFGKSLIQRICDAALFIKWNSKQFIPYHPSWSKKFMRCYKIKIVFWRQWDPMGGKKDERTKCFSGMSNRIRRAGNLKSWIKE